MRTAILSLAIAGSMLMGGCATDSANPHQAKFRSNEGKPLVILVHGGAGSARPGGMPEEDEAAYRNGLQTALNSGYAILAQGGSSIDAVTAAITTMEDNALFNAGKGAVLNAEGKVEMDSSIMNGADLDAGAVAGVTEARHPVLAARAVMERSKHVMMAGPGADAFIRSQGLQTEPLEYFLTPRRVEQLKRVQEKEMQGATISKATHFGTVGAVALDAEGHLAAATSTGGMTNKKWGRVGDSPIIGAGTYANDKACAVSATGWGEYFIRNTVARDICAHVQFQGQTVQQAADELIAQVGEQGGDGGVLVLGPDGDFAFSFNTGVMFRGVKTANGEEVAIFPEENMPQTK